MKKCELKEGDTIVMIGCGGLGHLGNIEFSPAPRPEANDLKAIQYAKAMKLRVIGIDISDSQLKNAKALGADLTYNSASYAGYADEIKQRTGGGAHAAVVLSASNAAYSTAPNVLR